MQSLNHHQSLPALLSLAYKVETHYTRAVQDAKVAE
jgi:hypothetical protein